MSARRLGVATQVALLAGPLLTMIDSSVVNVAVPAIARGLHAGLDSVQWTVSGYLLALAAGLAASAFLARRYGTRRIYALALAGFTLASGACALAPSVGVLIAARGVQGLLGAPLVPLSMSMLLGRDGASEEGSMPPAAGMLLFGGPAVGPALGGVLIHAGGWPLIFLIKPARRAPRAGCQPRP